MKNLLLILVLVFGSFSIKAQSKAAAIAEAAKFGIELAPKVAEAIWDITGMSAKPYMYPMVVDVYAARSTSGYTFHGADGDIIQFYAVPNDNSNLKNDKKSYWTLMQPKNTWWKGIVSHNLNGDNWVANEWVSCVNNIHSKKVLMDYNRTLDTWVTLSKAKGMGTHTNVYWISNSYEMTPDYKWTIVWLKD